MERAAIRKYADDMISKKRQEGLNLIEFVRGECEDKANEKGPACSCSTYLFRPFSVSLALRLSRYTPLAPFFVPGFNKKGCKVRKGERERAREGERERDRERGILKESLGTIRNP